MKTVSEILLNNDFPEKSLLMDGVTSNKHEIVKNTSLETTTNTDANSTLPDLVCNRTTNFESSKENQHKKTPTERLLDVFGSPIPSELEEDAHMDHLQGYHTTEDKDDAIDGLLALSNLKPKQKENKPKPKPAKSSSLDKHKTKGASKTKKSKKQKAKKS